ncbi:MAG: hypothetical protein KBS60_05820, partial [Phascolarctobacterium sp.]|nr:hypothetical protein [Candidatus Phascolarctobacterium caballi]
MADGQVVIDVKANTGHASKELLRLQQQMTKLESKANANSAKKSAIEQQMLNAQQSIEETKAKLEELKGKEERFKYLESMKGDHTKSQRQEYMDLYGEKESRAADIKAATIQYESQLKSYESLKNAANKLTAEEQQLNAELERQKGLIGSQMAADAEQGASAMDRLKESAGGTAPNFKKLFMTILKYGIGIRSLYILFRKLKQVVKESFTELAKTDAETKRNLDSLKASLAQLKGSFGAAFAPILNAVIPTLVKLIDWLTAAMNAIQQFFAVVAGKNSYKQAVANMAKLSGAAGSLKKQPMGFDEINKLDDGGGGGGGGAGYDYVEKLIDGQSLAAKLAIEFKDVALNWSNLTPENIAKKIIVGFSTLLGAIGGFLIGGVKGGLALGIEGMTLGLNFTDTIFNNDGKIDASELQSMIIAGIGAVLGGVIGAAIVPGAGMVIGAMIGLSLGMDISMKAKEDGKTPFEWLYDYVWVNGVMAFVGEFMTLITGDTSWSECGQACIDKLMDGFGGIGDSLTTWWNDSVKPWFTIEKWKELGTEAMQGIKDGLSAILPQFHLEWGTTEWGFTNPFNGNFVGVNIPYPDLQFYARGGIVDRTTLFGNSVVGEAGREAIIPL